MPRTGKTRRQTAQQANSAGKTCHGRHAGIALYPRPISRDRHKTPAGTQDRSAPDSRSLHANSFARRQSSDTSTVRTQAQFARRHSSGAKRFRTYKTERIKKKHKLAAATPKEKKTKREQSNQTAPALFKNSVTRCYCSFKLSPNPLTNGSRK